MEKSFLEQPTEIPTLENSGQLTFGEKLVGLTFNPSNDDKVSKAKLSTYLKIDKAVKILKKQHLIK